MDPIWIRSYPQGVPAQIDANALGTIADYLDDAVHLHADRAAFVSGATGERLLFSELDTRTPPDIHAAGVDGGFLRK